MPRSTIIPASAVGAPVNPVLSLIVLSSILISVRLIALRVPFTFKSPSTCKLPLIYPFPFILVEAFKLI